MSNIKAHTQGYAQFVGMIEGYWVVDYFDDHDHYFYNETYSAADFSEEEVIALVEDWATGKRELA